MGGLHGGFFIWDELEEVYGSKMAENAKFRHFLGKNRVMVPVPKSGTGTHDAVGKWYWYHCFLQPCFCMLCNFRSRIRTSIV